MSAVAHLADSGRTSREVREVPTEALMHSSKQAASLDHLVGEREQLVGDFKAERLRGLEVDHEFEFCRLHNRQIGRLLALENAAGIDAGLTIPIGNARRRNSSDRRP